MTVIPLVRVDARRQHRVDGGNPARSGESLRALLVIAFALVSVTAVIKRC